MKLWGFLFYPYKNHSYIIHTKKAEPNAFRPFLFFVLFYQMKYLFHSLFSRFLNAIIGSTLFHTLDS